MDTVLCVETILMKETTLKGLLTVGPGFFNVNVRVYQSISISISLIIRFDNYQYKPTVMKACLRCAP